MEAHDAAVATLSGAVRKFYDRKEPFRIYHGSTNSTRPSQYRRDNIVDTSGLTRVLGVDAGARTALVEPNVAMDGLVAATLPHGLVPPVVMEFPGITAGGGFSGTSGESSSFRYGFFDRTVNWVEIVLADGTKVTASRKDKPDLFWGAASAFGTLGVITLLEIQLVEAKKYVELTYHRCPSMKAALDTFEELIADERTEYLDGVVFAKDWFVICAGRATDSVPQGAKVQQFTRRRDPWFYLHAKHVTRHVQPGSPDPPTEAVPLVDYLFRYDKGGFWVGKFAFQYFCLPFDWFSRWLVDKYMRTRVLYRGLHKSGLSHQYVVQDVAVPFDRAAEFVDWLHVTFAHYPLWLCPLKQRGLDPDCPQGLLAEKPTGGQDEPEYLMNFGLWAPGPTDRARFVELNRALEKKVLALGGKKWLYAHAYYTEDEFWSVHDRPAYEALRQKYNAASLPSIYQKVRVDLDAEREAAKNAPWRKRVRHKIGAIWPVRGVYGMYKVLFTSGDYLLAKQEVEKKKDSARR